MIEVRRLTKDEFIDLSNNASDDVAFVRQLGEDAYNYFQGGDNSQGIVVDGVPIYCGCAKPDHYTDSIIRDGTREKYPKTLYKIVKATVIGWANILGDVRCKIISKCDEAMLIVRWIQKMGYVPLDNNVYILKGR